MACKVACFKFAELSALDIFCSKSAMRSGQALMGKSIAAMAAIAYKHDLSRYDI